jgi:hypothetical protein
MKEKDNILVCECCGSKNVESMAWVKVNGDRVSNYVGTLGEENNWCPECEEHVRLITQTEYEASVFFE